jgi:glycosyltransferase involved in cell wall biosynthesis
MTRPEPAAGPLISVLMGVYNAAPYLAEAIDSILGQSYRPLELVVVDDGSDDGSAEVAKSYGDSIVYFRQENGGDAAARNTAVRLAKGEVLAFIDADDRSPPGRLALQWAVLAADPELDAVFGHVREFLSPELTGAGAGRIRQPWPEPMPWVGVMPMMIRREAFARVGPFAETLRLGSSVDWSARAVDLGLRSIMLPEVLVERRLHPGSLSLREQEARPQYLDVVKMALHRKRTREREG